MSQTNRETVKIHYPFLIRITIFLSASVFGIAGAYFGDHYLFGLALYFCLATLFDGISHYVLHLKSSDFSVPEQLLESQRVTGEELDTYIDTRRYIRFGSLSLAIVSWAIAYGLSIPAIDVFCGAYILATLLGIFYVHFFVDIRRPRLIYRDDRYYVYYVPCIHHPNPGAYANFVMWQRHGPLDF